MTAWLPGWWSKSLVTFVAAISLFLLAPSHAQADSLAISNVSLTGHDSSANTSQIQFDISWTRSWLNNVNRDAVWLFAKYSTDAGVTWFHCTLKGTGADPSGFTGGSGTSMSFYVDNASKGAMMYRASYGGGSITNTDAEIVWDYAADGLADGSNAMVKLFGIEMVYVPTGSYSLGDSNASSSTPPGGLYTGTIASCGSTCSSITVSFTTLRTLGGTTSSTWKARSGMTTSDDFSSGTTRSLASTFPQALPFYIMKFELSQLQYKDFLNTLTAAQQINRTASQTANRYAMTNQIAATDRNALRVPASPGSPISFYIDYNGDGSENSTDGMILTANYLSWMDVAAYADWAALSPMTELEYEKAARGTATRVPLEFAWGSTDITAASSISGDGFDSETSGNTGRGLAAYNNLVSGPMRSGFAGYHTAKGRVGAGASFYGAFDLTGNLEEMVISIGSGSAGRSYTGSHGDGLLTSTSSYEGNATNTDWPGIDVTTSRGVTAATGAGTRGGSWASTNISELYVSSRLKVNVAPSTRANTYGGRLVRRFS